MKKLLGFIIIAMCIGASLKGQPIEQTGSIYKVSISPPNPTIHDSVILPLEIVFGDGIGTKYSSTLNIYSDTIVYTGCYYCSCTLLESFPTPDTIKLSPLLAGLYHVVVIARFPKNSQDTFCLQSNPAYIDTVDTFFVVSPVNAIETPSNDPFYAILEGFNTLKINTGTSDPVKVSVYDALGRQIYSNAQIVLQQGNNVIDLQLPALAQGVYFYRIDAGNKEKVLKYVKM